MLLTPLTRSDPVPLVAPVTSKLRKCTSACLINTLTTVVAKSSSPDSEFDFSNLVYLIAGSNFLIISKLLQLVIFITFDNNNVLFMITQVQFVVEIVLGVGTLRT